MSDYITSNNFKTLNNIPTSDTQDDVAISSAITSASRAIDTYCGRRFYQDGGTSAHVYKAVNRRFLFTQDISTATGFVLKFDTGDNGTYDKTVASTDYELLPYDGIVGGIETSPFYKIKMVEDDFPTSGERARVQVTARWGWASTPEAIVQACYLLASEYYFAKNAPFGIAGISEAGYSITTRNSPMVRKLIDPYKRGDQFGIA
jgi:hypothetical protein